MCTFFTDFLLPNQFAWKSWLIKFTLEHSNVENVFWIDAGIVPFGSLEIVFECKEQNSYF